MFKIYSFLLAASAFILFSGAARAEGRITLASNTPVKQSINPVSAELKDSATAQIRIEVAGYTDFDVFSSVNDPLYREGSRELLKQGIKTDAENKAAAKAALRDAPISKELQSGAPAKVKVRAQLKRAKAVKPLHADPVKVKDTF